VSLEEGTCPLADLAEAKPHDLVCVGNMARVRCGLLPTTAIEARS
jgi:hypothetical protein